MGHLDEDVMAEVNNAIAVSFGLHEGIRRDEDSPPAVPHDHTDTTPREAPSRIHHSPIADPRPAKSPQRVDAPAAQRPAAEMPNTAAANVAEKGSENRAEG